MKSDEAKQEVEQWIANGCDWNAGLLIYSKYGKNQQLVRNISGNPKVYGGKLAYELCKLAGLDYNNLKNKISISVDVQASVQKPIPTIVTVNAMKVETVSNKLIEDFPENIVVSNIGEYPPIMRRVITEYAETFQERSKTHRIMVEMPEGNSQALKTKRAELFSIVKMLTVRLELLFAAREQYDKNGQLPDEEVLWPTKKETPIVELPDDAEQLKKMKKNQQSANVKDQNMLDYQSEKKMDKPRPMPAGPKRMKLENRIKARIKLIEAIDYKLLKV